MSNLPTELKYAKSHEWIRQEEGDVYVVGITDHAQESLGDVVFVEPSEEGADVEAGDAASVVESVKAASDIYAPVSGEIVAFNENLEDSPEAINDEPYDGGWIFKIRIADASELEALLDADGYQAMLDAEE
ncbi:glycine cleavage system H protein [gamma proteobacterium HTCC5015]|nr:glycine cleavage system H protein [gamma proteobacterium HTCC5015]